MMFLALIEDESDKLRFVRVYDRYRQSVFLCARAILGDDALAEDASQETFLRIAKNIGKYEFGRNLVLTIARNAALSIKRKQDRETVSDGIELLAQSADERSGEYDYDLKADAARVFEIVNAMPETYSSVFCLRYAHGLKYSEIGELLDISAAAAKKRVQRAKEYIRQVMENEEG